MSAPLALTGAAQQVVRRSKQMIGVADQVESPEQWGFQYFNDEMTP
jgi:hypothetical protein